MIVRFHSEAQAELEDARAWYFDRNTEAAAQFVDEVLRVIEMVAEGPGRWPIVRRNTRRVQLRTFPFKVIYKYEEGGVELTIIAIAHDRRHPGYWRTRS